MTGARARIVEKLDRAAADPRLRDLFGAGHHRFRLNPALPADEIATFEAEHDIRLPESYRTFLLEVGDGGAGPGYGLLRLADAYAEVSDSFRGHLRTPSPFSPGQWYENDWWDGFWGPGDEPDPVQGTLAVVHHGCTGYTHLVVSGPGRGRLVRLDLNGVPAPYVLEDEDFLAWYHRWLDELLAGCSVTEFGYKIPGDESTLLAVLSGDPDPRRRAKAAHSVAYLPSTGRETAVAFAAAAADPDGRVRAAALAAARAAKVAVAPAARVALTDHEPTVRAEAIGVLAALGTPDLADRARELLADPDREVLWQTMRALTASGKLLGADLAPLLTRPDPNTRTSAVWHLIEAGGEVTPLLESALDDEDSRVRIHAVQAAHRRDERSLLRALRGRKAVEEHPTVLVNLDRVIAAWS
ncbi:HEAT repeat-containing protein [Amycolatopsis pretoriensis]|uniref:HEAT repeat-containing protein n=1 Tax=Amycolatopsis pretoriensis TaxID=218821 RepID=A0A1H5Q6R5_9PSEU|nr:HEAT repeat domain-containing protein [Amycolatopsis pretoriensis]SEF21725.1 HEAT repeat-containing protein [Amycolatopsis pretoriensis]